MQPKRQMSETFMVGVVMALSGGYMDAYTYILRDEVFANAQTGNIILLGMSISRGDWQTASQYILPIGAFVIGVFVAQLIRMHYTNKKYFHWRQLAVLIEIIIMIIVGNMGTSLNLLANSLVSFACGIQVQSFRKIQGNAAATTMCIGNLRTGTDVFCHYLHSKDKQFLHKSMLYFGIIIVFALGAVLGRDGVALFKEKAIWISGGILLAGMLMMIKSEK